MEGEEDPCDLFEALLHTTAPWSTEDESFMSVHMLSCKRCRERIAQEQGSKSGRARKPA